MVLILLSITWKNVSGFKFGGIFYGSSFDTSGPNLTTKLDFRKDQRILINKYLMTFKPFSSFCTEKMVTILAIFMFSCFLHRNSWNLQIWWFWVNNFCRKRGCISEIVICPVTFGVFFLHGENLEGDRVTETGCEKVWQLLDN